METILQANNIVWVFAIIIVGFVVIQATVFLVRALQFNKEHQLLTEEEVKMSARTGVFSVIGPAFSVMIAAISLTALMGSGASFMRIGVIGSAPYEIMLANIAADTLGVQLGTEAMTLGIFTLALFAMILGSAPYFINVFLTVKPMEKAMTRRTATTKRTFASIVGLIASIALMTYFGIDNARRGWVEIIVMLASGVASLLLADYAKKSGKKWVFEWILAVGLIAGLATSIVLVEVLGM